VTPDNDGGIAEVIHSADVDAPALDAGHSTFDAPQPNGLLVPPRDIPAAARALEFLILNPEARKQIGEAAQKKSKPISRGMLWRRNIWRCLRRRSAFALARLRRDEGKAAVTSSW